MPFSLETRFPISNFSTSEPMHAIVDYWCKKCGSAAHRIHARLQEPGSTPDLTASFPSLYVHGLFNLYGLDSGVKSKMSRTKNGNWTFNFMTSFPSSILLDVWGDRSMYFGDLDGDHVLDRIPPDAQGISILNFDVIMVS
jgi:alpha-1,3-glucan synthase